MKNDGQAGSEVDRIVMRKIRKTENTGEQNNGEKKLKKRPLVSWERKKDGSKVKQLTYATQNSSHVH
ncbi:hypothetical protein E2C01_019746 [Portunus trituberculatus]|uniref:Uncharacterized protein n=1 Tax=Portunus trituberculatus TaxID=210409 RepID=A0A5B7DY34_PORTR|nr:hypothetical protein [Portunus trituberculatus]